jgi:hypothetical protein
MIWTGFAPSARAMFDIVSVRMLKTRANQARKACPKKMDSTMMTFAG